MRARSRAFARNNEYGRKFFALLRTNIVGPTGFAFKAECQRPDGSIDKDDSDRVARAYGRWCKTGNFEVTGKLSESLFDALAITMLARDGEFLIRLVPGKDHGPHRFQVQLLPGHLLDEEHNRDLSDGRRIRMGVEFNRWMKPIAYHIRLAPQSGDMQGNYSQRYERVSADDMMHVFIPEDAEQWRGIPWAFAALRSARHHEQYDEAAIVAANVGAAKMGFYQQGDPDAAPISSETQSDGEGGEDFITEATPGEFGIIPDGYTLKDWNPAYPHEMYESFTKAVLRRMSTGLLSSYHSISGDLTDVNFSSIRAGTLDDRDLWKLYQATYSGMAKVPLFERWLGYSLLFDEDLKQLPYAKFDKFNAPVFQGRRWEWVSPKDDVKAKSEEVALGINSRSQIIRERGGDPEKVFQELQDEEEIWGFSSPTITDTPEESDADEIKD